MSVFELKPGLSIGAKITFSGHPSASNPICIEPVLPRSGFLFLTNITESGLMSHSSELGPSTTHILMPCSFMTPTILDRRVCPSIFTEALSKPILLLRPPASIKQSGGFSLVIAPLTYE